MGDIIVIADECFTDGLVISYKGENYYKACDTFVYDRPEGGQTFCVKRVGHPGEIHEDYIGRTLICGCVDTDNIVDALVREVAIVTAKDDIPDCPDCVQGKHKNCLGTSWNRTSDKLDMCPCEVRNHDKP